MTAKDFTTEQLEAAYNRLRAAGQLRSTQTLADALNDRVCDRLVRFQAWLIANGRTPIIGRNTAAKTNQMDRYRMGRQIQSFDIKRAAAGDLDD